MKFSWMGRIALAMLASIALGLGMTACGGGTIGFIWVLGDQFNQITGFKVDDFTGNLTQIIGSPFSSNGVNPVSIVVKPGGRYVYVVNQGTGGTRPTRDPVTGNIIAGKETSGGVAVYSVGGDGVLTFQQSYQTQGNTPVWAQFDGGGSFLYVLDRFSPDPKLISAAVDPGSITAFSVDGTTGRLTLVTNNTILVGGIPTTFFNVGPAPTMLKTAGGCLFTLDTGDNSVFPYAFGSNGQLMLTTPGSLPISASSLSSINGNGNNIYLTDQGANRILPFTAGSNCNLATATGGPITGIAGTSNPVYSFVDNAGKFLYVLNQSTTTTNVQTPFSSISAYVISPQLTVIPDSPFPVGSGPVCMVEDTSSQYVYISNRNDGSVTGNQIDAITGDLRPLKRGSTFPASGLGSCLALSGAVN
ncbi:MAG: lactonase family protein [Acidobacteriota bacterium]|nr:lactonase family protein [Acidobacteriota bacterium]